MTEIPEHLLKRAQAARAKAKGGANGGGGDAPAASDAPDAAPAGDAPSGGGGTAVATRERTATAVPTVPAPGGGQLAGPEGHTQRLLTVVKAGSIQDVRAQPVDKVHVWPHLLLAEFVSALVVTAFLLVFSAFVNAPLLTLANFNLTPNPSKAPWYFLGLQELLTMFHPMVAGVTLPGVGLVAFAMAPFVDKNPSNKPEDRKFVIMLWTIHLMFWAVLVLIGSFFRGPGQNFVFPWVDGLFFEL